MSSLSILWDESHIWGLLAWRAIHALGLPYSVVRAEEIAGGALEGNDAPAVLFVPGGVARRKALFLGDSGMSAIRDYVHGGGSYMGFCGGAGLGLTGKWGLGLCPWKRAPIKDRVLHLISGRIQVSIDGGSLLETGNDAPLVPVWWPARFEANGSNDVGVLAAYQEPGPDFWVADLPLASLPSGTFSDWEALYGLKLRPADMAGQPCIVHGKYGKGRYVLSYAHLETPGADEANGLMCRILAGLAGEGLLPGGACRPVPEWELGNMQTRWDDPGLAKAAAAMDNIFSLGQEQYLLFPRNKWLYGWRAGLPGANLNHLNSLIRQVCALTPTDEALALWDSHRKNFLEKLDLFQQSVSGYLLAERLSMTLAKALPDAISQQSLLEQRTALFGEPMEHGGIYAELLDVLDELAFLCIRAEASIK